MKETKIAIAVLVFAGFLWSAFSMAPVLSEQTIEEYPALDLEAFIDTVGNHFEITDSTYLNITLMSSENVHVVLESASTTISLFIESMSSANSTSLTFSGFKNNVVYYMHQDGFLIGEFMADSSGGYTYTQDISEPHHVYILEHASTLYLYSDYTFTSNISEDIVVKADNIVIDGNGYTLQGPGSGYGFYLEGRNGVTIKNVTITGWTAAVYMYGCTGNTLSDNSISNNLYGIELSAENDYNTMSSNSISDNQRGIFLYRYDDNNTISDNLLSGNWYNIYLFASDANTISGNLVENGFNGVYLYSQDNENIICDNSVNNNRYGIRLGYSLGNIIYHNNIVDNVVQAVDSELSENNWHHPELLEGNYWSDYPGVDDGSGTDKHAIAGDGIGDTDIPWFNDFYPLMYPRISDPIETCHELIETIESWDLPNKGTANCLISKLEDALSLLDQGNINGAIRKIGDFIKQVTNDRKNLTDDQRSYLLALANAIIFAISG